MNDILLERDVNNDDFIVKGVQVSDRHFGDHTGIAEHLLGIVDKLKTGEIQDFTFSSVYRTKDDNIVMEHGHDRTHLSTENPEQPYLVQVEIQKGEQYIFPLYEELMSQLAIAVGKPITFGAGTVNYADDEYSLGFGQQTEEYCSAVTVYIEDQE